jgi:HK97 family phage prohead protease
MMQRKTIIARTEALAAQRQVKVTVSTESLGRDGLIVVTDGIDLSDYRRNSVVLWDHDPAQPVARAISIAPAAGNLVALAQFPAEGVSPKADEVYGLIREKIVNAASIGFDPIEAEPIDPKDPWNGQRITKCSLLEFSFVAIPALQDALITERARRDHGNPAEGWKCGAAGDLPISEDRSWDADAARARVFRAAGFDGEHADPVKARRAFLAYNASKPLLRESYKLPFADVIDGRLTAIRRGLDAAASMLERTDIPEREKARARQVIAAYEAKEPDRGHLPFHYRARAERYDRDLAVSAPRRSLEYHRARAERIERDMRLGR